MTNAADMLESGCATLSDVLRAHGCERRDKIAVVDERADYTDAELDRTMDRIAAALQRDGISPGQPVARRVNRRCQQINRLIDQDMRRRR